MRDPHRARLARLWCGVGLAAALITAASCRGYGADAGPRTTAQRAAARAYDGAPPVIPHDASATACRTCHDDDGTEIPGIGVAPASPHGEASSVGSMSRCRRCHVPRATSSVMVASGFIGLPQGVWRTARATPGAPPTIPHPLFLRTNCLACHAGAGSRVEIRTPHPERIRCQQCHVEGGS